MSQSNKRWDLEVDIVAVGSGMGGCCAAIAAHAEGLETVLLEKSDKLGGATAYSLGIVWVGDNHLERALGMEDSLEETLAYLKFLAAGQEDQERLQVYVDVSPVALRYFVDKIGLPLYAVPGLPDYYYKIAPGARPEGRSLQVRPLAAKTLGPWRERLRAPPATPRLAFEEMARWGGRARYKDWDQEVVRRRVEEDSRTFGAGLVAQLAHILLQQRIPIHLKTAAQALIVEDGRVQGLVADQEGRQLRIKARRGVVLASGSYHGSSELSRRFEEIQEGASVVPASVDGDGLVLATELGAAMARREIFQRQLVYAVPGEEQEGAPAHRAAGNNETGFPHSVLVNQEGSRFADETIGQQFGLGLRSFDTVRHRYVNVPVFLIFDQTYLQNYGFGSIRPGQPAPAGWPVRSGTLSGLARQLEIDPASLTKTVRRFNRFARLGKDPDYGRGTFPFANAVSGDLAHKPNPSLGPLEKPPFYGVRLMPSGSGSMGLVTDGFGRVLHVRGHAIPNLYACGTAAAGFYGIGYQAGCQLGGAMTFGYIAVKHAAGRYAPTASRP